MFIELQEDNLQSILEQNEKNISNVLEQVGVVIVNYSNLSLRKYQLKMKLYPLYMLMQINYQTVES